MIREAEPRDREEIQRLYEVLCPGAPVRVLPERIAAIKEDPNNFLFVDEVDGKIVRTVLLTVILSPIFGTQDFGLIEYLIVAQNYRRQGIGRRLMEHVFTVCRGRQCTRIILLSNDHRKEAHAFMRAWGLTVRGKLGCDVSEQKISLEKNQTYFLVKTRLAKAVGCFIFMRSSLLI